MSQPQNLNTKIKSISLKTILMTWLPLVGSWLIMSIELPTINAIVARLPEPEINLAAYGGVVFPIALAIEAPVIMLLAASTALSRDWQSYQRLKKITLWMGGFLMAVHILVAITPIYDFIVNILLDVPAVVVEPGRMGLLFLSPWTLGIAYRRFQQGTMIRFNRSHMVGETTVIRLITVSSILTLGILTKRLPGTVLAGLAQGLGVTSEAIYAGLRIRKILPDIKQAPQTDKPLTLKRFVPFYFPLALTSYLWFLWQPLISASISRMPDPLESLAIWSVVTGLLFVFRAPGMAFNETVVAMLDIPQAYFSLRKFASILSMITLVFGLIIVLTPVSNLWFTFGANLSKNLVPIAMTALSIGVPLTFMTIYINFFQGIIVKMEQTGPVAEAVVAFLLVMLAVLLWGVSSGRYKGVYVASAAYTAAHIAQAGWLFIRSRKGRLVLTGEQAASEG